MKPKQSGFTLIEIAIVLVIIGLLLGGVLKGQALVDGAKVKALANEMKAAQTAFYAYQDKFRTIPGDDAAAITHLGATVNGIAIANAAASNGVIDTGTWVGLPTIAVAANESALFWMHTRAAGLMTGSAGIGEAINSTGGKLGVTNTSPSNTLAGTKFICSGGIDGVLAAQLDTMLDDGVGTTGTVQGRVGAAITAAAAGEAYAPGSTYTVCMSF